MDHLSWKQRQELYHQANEIEDYITHDKIKYTCVEEEIIDATVKYFSEDSDVLTFPSKSYAVAIIYAKLLEENFVIPFMDALDDPDLLYGNDNYFKPYSKAKRIYDKVLELLPDDFMEAQTYGVQKTKEYFAEEFLLVEAS